MIRLMVMMMMKTTYMYVYLYMKILFLPRRTHLVSLTTMATLMTQRKAAAAY
jgi:hypothetical protein